jgi:hypothetical protein
VSRILVLIAVIIFALTAFGEWPIDDLDGLATGLAVLSASFLV